MGFSVEPNSRPIVRRPSVTQEPKALRKAVVDQLRIDEHGELSVDGIPSVLLPVEFLREMKSTGEKFMGRGLHGIIYHVGEQFGRSITERTRSRKAAEPEKVFARIARDVQLRGWGRVEVVRFDIEVPSCLVRLPDCPQDDLTKRRKRPWCPLLPGFVAGVLGVLSGRGVLAEETSCRSMGAAYCEVSAVGYLPALPAIRSQSGR